MDVSFLKISYLSKTQLETYVSSRHIMWPKVYGHPCFFSGFAMMGNLNATAHSDILDLSVLRALHQQFVFVRFLVQHDNVHTASSIKKRCYRVGVEELWDETKRRVGSRTSALDLTDALVAEKSLHPSSKSCRQD